MPIQSMTLASDFWDAEDVATEIGEHPCVWTDGSREVNPTGGFSVAGAAMYLPAPDLAMQGATWGVAEEYGDVPGPFQTVQRAEFWGTILALLAFWR